MNIPFFKKKQNKQKDEPKATVDPDAELRDLLEKVGKQDETAVKKLYEAIENDKKRKPRKVIAPSPLNVKPAEYVSRLNPLKY